MMYVCHVDRCRIDMLMSRFSLQNDLLVQGVHVTSILLPKQAIPDIFISATT